VKTSCVRLSAAAAVLVLSLGAGRSAGAEEITYDGATTIGLRVMKDVQPAFEQKTGVKITSIGMSGAGKGLKAALAGQVSVAGVSRSLTSEELASKPYFQIIGYDALGVFVNDKNPVKALTKAQLKAIYTGKIKSWKDVGGAATPIVACIERLNGGRATVDLFRALVLDGDAFGPVKEVEDALDCVKLAATDPGVVGPASMAYALTGARAVPLDGVKPTADDVRAGTYSLARPLLLVSKARPAGGLKQLFDFVLSAEGQAIVGKSFFAVR